MHLWLIALLLTVSIFIHECGHLLAYRIIGTRVDQLNVGFGPPLLWRTDRQGTRWALRLLPLGGYVTAPNAGRLTPLKRGLGAFAGPVASMLLSCTALFVNTFAQTEWLLWLGYVNAALVVFNLTPFPPFDGGRMLLAWLEHRRGKPWVKQHNWLFGLGGLGALVFLSVFPLFIHWEMVPKPKIQKIYYASVCLMTTHVEICRQSIIKGERP